MEVTQHNASHKPGIISVPDTTTEPASPKFIISAVPDMRTFMEEQNINTAWIIYFDTYEEALKFREELHAHAQPTMAKET